MDSLTGFDVAYPKPLLRVRHAGREHSGDSQISIQVHPMPRLNPILSAHSEKSIKGLRLPSLLLSFT
jgi:hypothetical protein